MSSSIPKGPTWAVRSTGTGYFLGPAGTWKYRLEDNAIAFYSREEALEHALKVANAGGNAVVVRTRYVPGAKRYEETGESSAGKPFGTPVVSVGFAPASVVKEIDPAPGRWEIVG